MAKADDYVEVYSAFDRHDNYNEEYAATINKLSSELNLDSVKSCLIIGPGDGQHDLYFIKQCVPNIKKIIAVEPDQKYVECLPARLEKSLPGVDSQVIKTTIQIWKGLDDPVDLVVMSNVLYYVSPSERKELFKKFHDQLLTTGGRVVMVSASHTTCPGNAAEVFTRLGTPITTWEDIELDMLEAGFTKQYARDIQCTRDFSDLEEPYLRFYQYVVDQPVTLDDVRNVIKELFPDGKSDQGFFTFGVFQKA